jgi:hypothetical protein
MEELTDKHLIFYSLISISPHLNQKKRLMPLMPKLRNLSYILGAKSPTVLWSGNGYHIYQPLESYPLEQEEIFISKSAEPSREFLQFAEQYLTNYKSDPSHHPSFKSCMIRIPGSHNYKLVQKKTIIMIVILQIHQQK